MSKGWEFRKGNQARYLQVTKVLLKMSDSFYDDTYHK